MFGKFLRENKIAAAIITVLRIYLGYLWLTSGLHKIQSGAFDATGFLKNAVANPVKSPDGVVYGWYVDFLQHFAIPNADLFNAFIPYAEFLIGLGLILGCFTTIAAFFGLIMNFSFLLAGVIAANPTYIILGFIMLAAGPNAGRYGLDRYVLPQVRKNVKKE